MKVEVNLKCGRKIVFENVYNYTVQKGVLCIHKETKNEGATELGIVAMFNFDEVINVCTPEETKMNEYNSTLGGTK